MEGRHMRYTCEFATSIGIWGAVALGTCWETWDTPQSSPLKKEESGYFSPNFWSSCGNGCPWVQVADTCRVRHWPVWEAWVIRGCGPRTCRPAGGVTNRRSSPHTCRGRPRGTVCDGGASGLWQTSHHSLTCKMGIAMLPDL